MTTVGTAVAMFNDLNFEKSLDLIAVDDTGLGGGVTDRLNELGYNVLPINFGSSATEPEGFMNLKAEIYWFLRHLFREGEISLQDCGKLVSQIPTIRYTYPSSGKLQIVSKDVMKREGFGSPDDADALAIACWGVKMATSNFPSSEVGKGPTILGNIYRKQF